MWSMLLLVTTVLYFSLVSATLDNENTRWLKVAHQIVRDERVPNAHAARQYAFVSLAQLVALRNYRNATVTPKTTTGAALNVAGHAVLSAIYPWRQSPLLDGILKRQLANLTNSEKQVASAIGSRAAYDVIKNKIGDATTQWADFEAAPQGTLYCYQYTPAQFNGVPAQTLDLYPQLGSGTPLFTPSAEVKRIVKQFPYDKTYGTPKYQADLQECYEWGNYTSSKRVSSYDNNTPLFWDSIAGTHQVAGQMLDIAFEVLPANISIDDSTLMLARINVAMYDANLVGWKPIKYTILHWRPISAFRIGAPNGPPQDPYWTPYITLGNPPHPEYPSGHTLTSGAGFQILVKTLGTEDVTFTIPSDHVPKLEPRTYNSLRTARIESGLSRLYGGIHFRAANEDGFKIGGLVADVVWDRLK